MHVSLMFVHVHMDDDNVDDPELLELRAQRLKERLSVSVIRVAEAEALKSHCAVSTSVMAAVADLTFKYAEQLGRELELFAHHAGRKSINVDDVILAAHRNEDIASTLKSLSKELSKSKDQQPERKRKKNVAKSD